MFYIFSNVYFIKSVTNEKTNIAIHIILLFTFFACKKKEATPTPVNTAPTSGVGMPNGLVKSTGGDYCSLSTTYKYTQIGLNVNKDSIVQASFNTGPAGNTPPTYVNGGTVTINNIPLTYNNLPPLYFISSGLTANITGPITWDVTGSGTVTAFNQSFIPSYPHYNGAAALPDTCIKANGITINITGVTNNQNSVVVYLNLGTASLYKYILGSNGSVTFSASELASLPTSQTLTIDLFLTNAYSATHNGFKHGFTNGIQYTKYSFLK